MASPRLLAPDLVPLTSLPRETLLGLFEAERELWRSRLGWDIPGSAEALAQAVDWGIVRGSAACVAGRAVGFLAIQPGLREARPCGVLLPPEAAGAAAGLVADALAEAARVRVEGQLVAFETQPELDLAFRRAGLCVEPREFLNLTLAPGAAGNASGLPAPRPSWLDLGGSRPRVRPLEADDLEACAAVLVEAHAGGVEARINQAFRDESTALAYLRELVEADGCGRVEDAASGVVVARGRVAGFCVATSTAPGVGHVAQVALAPAAQGQGLGSLLLGRAIEALARGGCGRVTLSVSRANGRASAWYRRLGFRPIAAFASYHRDAPG